MKVFVYYETTNEPWGGINTFFKNFKKYCKGRKDVELVDDINADYDIFLIGSAYYAPGKLIDIDIIKAIKQKKKVKIIIRLDGLRSYYNSKLDEMDKKQFELLNISDFVVFQSEYSHKCFKKSGYNKHNYSIIYNGVDNELFNDNEKEYELKSDKIKILSVNWSSNINKGYDIISSFANNRNIEMLFVGNWNNDVKTKNIKLLPPMDHIRLAQLYKTSDLFLHPALHDACPNVVVEALSSGLPVLFRESGGVPELVKDCGIKLPDIISDRNVEEVINRFFKNYSEYAKKVKNRQNEFSFENVINNYLSVFKKVHNNEL